MSKNDSDQWAELPLFLQLNEYTKHLLSAKCGVKTVRTVWHHHTNLLCCHYVCV